uniref:Uncharacterized protein n=1 Tax=Geospiza parvula TaxID=87175 RepID=A0A8U8AWS9_GEOPR
IISWLVLLWDAAGEVTILDGTEARHLGSLSQDTVIDQGMMSRASPHSLWERVLESVAQRYLCADDLYMQQTGWKTIEQGIQRLREMAVAELIFSDDVTTRNPDLVPCTPVMWRKLVRLGPPEYASALAIMKRMIHMRLCLIWRRSFEGMQMLCMDQLIEGTPPRAELWAFLRESGEDMRRWDGEPTAALAQWVRDLKRRGSITKKRAVCCSQPRC